MVGAHELQSAGGIQRRTFLGNTAALGLAGAGAGAAAGTAVAQNAAGPGAGRSTSGSGGATILIRGGHVLTMDPAIADLEKGDVLVRDGRIVDVKAKIDPPPGAEIVDATDCIVMPGFVDTHTHLWEGAMRGALQHDDPVRGYFPSYNRLAYSFPPEGRYASVRFDVAQGLLSGVTCMANFAHNIHSAKDADAEIRGALETGVRHLFYYGPPAGYDNLPHRLDRNGVTEIMQQWQGKNPLLTLGVNFQPTADKGGIILTRQDDPEFAAEFAFARKNGLPITMHYGRAQNGMVGFMNRQKLLGPDIVLVHPQGFTQEERDMLVREKVSFAMAPVIETNYSRVRNGHTQFDELERLGASIGMGIDSCCATANYDFFGLMRAALWQHRSRADVNRLSLTPKRIVELATIDGARAIGMERSIGSLTPGKFADVITVKKTDINMAPVIYPYFALVYSGMPQNVQMTMVGGKILARQGAFTTLDMTKVVSSASEFGRALYEKSEELIGRKG